MVMSSSSAAGRATALLLGLGVALAVGPVPAAVAAEPATGGRTPAPYRPDGLLVRLPGGGQIRLVWPREDGRAHAAHATPSSSSTAPGHGTGGSATPRPAPSAPASSGATSRPPSAKPSASTTASPPTTASAKPASPSAAPARHASAPSAAPSVLPVPVLSTLFPVPVPGRYRVPGAGSSTVPCSPSAAAGPARGTPGAPAGGGSRHSRPSEDQDPGRTAPTGGPPPLGPGALAGRPLPDRPVAVRTGSARELLNRRLLPLGVGLSLIGCGAALFGWRLRRM